MADHRLDLLLVRAAGADHRLLDDAGVIFADDQPGLGRGQQDDAARLTQFQRGLGVGIAQHLLHRRAVRAFHPDHFGQRGVEIGQAAGQGHGRLGLDLAVADMAQPIALRRDDTPAGGAETGIETEQDHAGWINPASP